MNAAAVRADSQSSPAPGLHKQEGRARVLAICTVDVMAWKLLRPWLGALADARHEVHIACSSAQWFDQLAADGFHMHEVPLRRRLNPLAHIAPLWALYRLIRRGRFTLVNTHSPVAAAVGRLAAWLARAPVIIYVVHGFYFHDDMPRWKRRCYVALERLLGRITDGFMFVSDEDRQAAFRERIATDPSSATTIYNGVDLDTYPPRDPSSPDAQELRTSLDIPLAAPVVGIVGRVVRGRLYRVRRNGKARLSSPATSTSWWSATPSRPTATESSRNSGAASTPLPCRTDSASPVSPTAWPSTCK